MGRQAGGIHNDAGGGNGVQVRPIPYVPGAAYNKLFGEPPSPMVVGPPVYPPIADGTNAANIPSPGYNMRDPNPGLQRHLNRHHAQNEHASARRDVNIPVHIAQQNPGFGPVVNDRVRQAGQIANAIVDRHEDGNHGGAQNAQNVQHATGLHAMDVDR
jgi:hypothetical protein